MTSTPAERPARGPLVTAASVRAALRKVLVTLFAFILALVIGAILMVVADSEITPKFTYFFARPSDALMASWTKISTAYGALLTGALGGLGPITTTLTRSAPLICAGLGIGLAFRAGLFNIGAQGQAVVGSMIAALVGFSVHGLPLVVHLPLAILAGVLAGAAWGAIPGILKARTGAHEVIVTIMLNYVATNLQNVALNNDLFQRPGRNDAISPIIDTSAMLPILGGQLHLGFFLALAAAALVWWILERTTLGFQIKAVGANPHASATAGMSVAKVTVAAMAISGALAGMAGVQVALGATEGRTPTPLSAGLVDTIGFDAITVALLGRSKPLGIVGAGLLFGAMKVGGLAMQRTADTPHELIMVLQALIVLFVGAPALVRTLVPFLKQRLAKSTEKGVA